MGDKLEKFISQNKEAFDEDGPSEDLWNKIEGNLEEEKQESWWSYWKVASMLFLVTTVVLLVDRMQPQQDAELAQATTLSEEFTEAEQFYSRLISERKQQIDSYDVPGDLRREFLDEMNELDDLYLELRSTFEKKSGDQKLIDAMISNMRLRMRILDRQIEILERLNDYKNEGEEAIIA